MNLTNHSINFGIRGVLKLEGGAAGSVALQVICKISNRSYTAVQALSEIERFCLEDRSDPRLSKGAPTKPSLQLLETKDSPSANSLVAKDGDTFPSESILESSNNFGIVESLLD